MNGCAEKFASKGVKSLAPLGTHVATQYFYLFQKIRPCQKIQLLILLLYIVAWHGPYIWAQLRGTEYENVIFPFTFIGWQLNSLVILAIMSDWQSCQIDIAVGSTLVRPWVLHTPRR